MSRRLQGPPPRGPMAVLLTALDSEDDTDLAVEQLAALEEIIRELAFAGVSGGRVAVDQLAAKYIRQIEERADAARQRDRDEYLTPAERRGMELADLEHARSRDVALATT